ncbi:hypothetical protein ACFSKU_15545 [Pontibacter silvestris]|uniref:Uncharacterized protein n=1 Tax=Pontibacter silvestris TaxID=2305183 RepID=A0ABW4X009_9BACT|nr:hypothetical protein [Pontibacter silvestris]MCC9137540.1 hypothetical protein [Pontibacter silvestris]
MRCLYPGVEVSGTTKRKQGDEPEDKAGTWFNAPHPSVGRGAAQAGAGNLVLPVEALPGRAGLA